MAYLIPDKPFATQSTGELELFEVFRQQLPNPYYVLHSLRWTGAVGKVEGEVDFIILHPQKGILLVEVKAGNILFENRQLYQENRNNGERYEIDPIGQLRSSRGKLIKLVKERCSKSEFFPVGYIIWFPSGTIKGILPPEYSPQITADARNLEDVNAFITNALRYYNELLHGSTNISTSSFENVLKTLCGNFYITGTLQARFKKEEAQFIRLTNEQVRILDFLEEQPRAIISGKAGTGKTIVALEKAKRIAQMRKSVLYICYNSNLAAFLREGNSLPFLNIKTFHSLCRDETPGSDKYSINELPEVFLEKLVVGTIEFSYDHVIIDEGQDFKDDWINILSLFTKETFFVFYDKHQLIQRTTLPEWFTEADCKLGLTKCVRSTREIAYTSLQTVNQQTPEYYNQSAEGVKPRWHNMQNQKDVMKHISKIIKEHQHERKVDLSDFVILTLGTEKSELYLQILRYFPLKTADKPTLGHICLSTVRKFKGLEAKVAFVVDGCIEDFGKPEKTNLLYTAFSRACHELHIYFPAAKDDSFKLALGIKYKDRARKISENLFLTEYKLAK